MAEDKKPQDASSELEDYSKEEVIQTFRHFQSHRSAKEEMWKKIRRFHSGQFWSNLKKKLPKHQIMPDTNFVEYIEKNIVNSVYAGAYMAKAMPRSFEDKELVRKLNQFLSFRKHETGIKEMFPQLGSDTVLFNFAGIQVGWNPDHITKTSKQREQGKVELGYVPPNQIYLDPSVTDYRNGRAIFRSRRLTIFDLLNEDGLKDEALDYIKYRSNNDEDFKPVSVSARDAGQIFNETGTSNEYSREIVLLEAFYKVETDDGYRIDHLFIVDNDYLLKVKKDIEPKEFPIRILYGEKPKGDPYGVPMIYKILPNIITYNMLNSLESTHVYNTQNRAKFVNIKSGVNIKALSKYGNTPHIAFAVNGNPDEVVKYNDVQMLPDISNLKLQLREDIFLVTGVDMRYTGRDTGSIQTTGGTDLAQQRTMTMTDSLRIINLENFVEDVTRVFVDYYISFGGKYGVVSVDERSGEVQEDEDTIDFNELDKNRFNFSLEAGPELPKNKVRLSEAADALMEMQGQYNFDPPIITPEEWLGYKDFPQTSLQLERMRSNEKQNDRQDIENTLLDFAGMLDKGLQPEEAIEIMLEERQQKRKDPKLGQDAGPMQGQGPL